MDASPGLAGEQRGGVLPGGEFSGERAASLGRDSFLGQAGWAAYCPKCQGPPVGCGGDGQGRNELPLGLLICPPQALVCTPVL